MLSPPLGAALTTTVKLAHYILWVASAVLCIKVDSGEPHHHQQAGKCLLIPS